jgi:hypothetical protein
MSIRQQLSPQGKQVVFSRAFDVVNAYRAARNCFAAYVLAFSIFEDRLTAAVYSAAEHDGLPAPKGHLTLYKRVERLHSAGHLSDTEARNWRLAGDERNELIHAAMWQMEVFSDHHVTHILKIARQADRVATRLRRAVVKIR